MDNPFKHIENEQVLPEKVKKNVMSSIESLSTVMECIELFSSRVAGTLGSAFFDYEGEDSPNTDASSLT